MAKVKRQRVKKRPAKKATKKKRKAKASPPFETGGYCGKSPISMVIYGPSGVGKTSLAANFPGVGFMIDPHEDGISELVEYGQAPSPIFTQKVENWVEALTFLDDTAADPPEGLQTLAIDSTTGMELLCFTHLCDDEYNGDWGDKGFLAYGQGPKSAAKLLWPMFITALEDLKEAGINVILLAHSTVKDTPNPDGPNYSRHTPYMDKETWAALHRWAGAILFYNYHVETEKKDLRHKAKAGSEDRFLFTEWGATWDGKNRWGLDLLIEAGESGGEAYSNFEEAFKKAQGVK